ncbi:MAG: hypothetical protein P4L82_11935 [Ancalomicrobiaceae bacterium]|nr:hypothetical protein [Ancalomicrobiaceae bacterium]
MKLAVAVAPLLTGFILAALSAAFADDVSGVCGLPPSVVDEVSAEIGASRLPDVVALGFLAVFNRVDPATHYTGPIDWRDHPKDDRLEFIVRDGATDCLFKVGGPLRAAILKRFLGEPS